MKIKLFAVFLAFSSSFAQPFSNGFPKLQYIYTGCTSDTKIDVIHELLTDVKSQCSSYFNYKPDPKVAIKNVKINQIVYEYLSYTYQKKYVEEVKIFFRKEDLLFSSLDPHIGLEYNLYVDNTIIQKYEKFTKVRVKCVFEYSNGIQQPFEISIPVVY